jgi:hypothetical protein
MARPNGLPFSCRKRAAETCQKAFDLARAAVGWNGGLGWLASNAGLHQWHARTARHDERSAEPHTAHDHAGTTDIKKRSHGSTTGGLYERV